MPWAHHEPLDFPTRRNIVNGFIEKFIQKQDFTFGIFSKKEMRCIGSTGLHTRLTTSEREIGYWIHAAYEGKGYITEAVTALTKVGFEIENLTALEIHCQKDNVKSLKVPEKLGYHKLENVNSPILFWRLELNLYSNISQYKNFALRSYDAKGKRLL